MYTKKAFLHTNLVTRHFSSCQSGKSGEKRVKKIVEQYKPKPVKKCSKITVQGNSVTNSGRYFDQFPNR